MRSLPSSAGRRALLAAAAAALSVPPQPSIAWCGENYPSWAYFLKWDENPQVPVSYDGAQAKAFYRIVGDQTREKKTGVPPVLVVGDPGIGYNYLENFEALTVSDRRIIEVAFAGTGKGALAPQYTTPDACAAQLAAICKALKLPAVHVVGHGMGALPALRFAAGGAAADGVRASSLTLISPYGSAADLRPDAISAVGSAKSVPEIVSTLLPTVSSNARDTCVAEAKQASAGPLLLPFLSGASGGDVALSGGALATKLAACPPSLPVLLATGGARDIVDTESWQSLPPTVQRRTFPKSGHLPFVEERDDFLLALLEHFDAADGKETNREFKFGDTIETLKEMRG